MNNRENKGKLHRQQDPLIIQSALRNLLIAVIDKKAQRRTPNRLKIYSIDLSILLTWEILLEHKDLNTHWLSVQKLHQLLMSKFFNNLLDLNNSYSSLIRLCLV